MENAEIVDFLLSDQGQKALFSLKSVNLADEYTLPLLQELRRSYTPEQAGAILSLARLRRRGERKFPFAHQLFFTDESLQQATAWQIAQHRATWIHEHAPPGKILDLGCGIGSDTLALAQYRSIVAYDLDPIRLRFAQANAQAFGVAERIEFRLEDWTTAMAAGSLPNASAAFADPGRRHGNRRIFSLHQMQPPLQFLLQLQQRIPVLGVKVMPSVKEEEIPREAGVEFISHLGVCKEAVLWFGSPAVTNRWATILTEKGSNMQISSGFSPPIGPLKSGQYLHEPDPALIRTGAFFELCTQLKGHLFDSQIAYIASNQQRFHPFTQSFYIEEIHPFNLKKLNRCLQDLKIGQVELKKRGMPIEPEALRSRLKLASKGKRGVVIFTRCQEKRLMLIGQRVENQ